MAAGAVAAAVIALVAAVNTTVGVVQEFKADRAITALSALTMPEALVLRDGVQQVVPAVEVVVDEAALTGESVPVGKASPWHWAPGEWPPGTR